MKRLAQLLSVLGGAAVLGAVAAAVVLAVVVHHGFRASDRPSAIEALAARTLRRLAVPSDAKARKNPLPATKEVLDGARMHFADHCATCHANDGSGDTPIGKHLYPPAPDMRAAATQSLTDGELYWIIDGGVRLTGMPAWGTGNPDDEETWALVRFIRHLPALTAEERKEMEAMNPRSPMESKEEQEEEQFLGGDEAPAAPVAPQQHHTTRRTP